MAKRYEELTIADDFMFGKVMEDKALCREVLECLLDHPTRKIEEAVGRARKNEEWRSEYMKELLHDDDVREEGRAEGREEGRRAVALRLKAMNMPVEQIAQALEENVEVVEQWLADSAGSRSNVGGIPLAKL